MKIWSGAAMVAAMLMAACGSPAPAGGAAPRAAEIHDCVDCPPMIVIPAGVFTMGSPADEPGRQAAEQPQRQVAVRSFAIGRFDVTRGEWAAFVAATGRPVEGGCAWAGPLGSRPDPGKSWRQLDFPQDDHHPVVCVSWADARDYARWLSLRTGHVYRLPSEAEWEYAARAGSTTAFPWGPLASHHWANYGAEACCSGRAVDRDRWVGTSPVGAFPANAFGLFDMHGNVLQWVQDCLSTSYAALPPDGTPYQVAGPLQADPFLLRGMAGRDACDFRMLRGGDWGDPPRMIRSAFRNYGPPAGSTLADYRSAGVGFRVARALD